MKTFKEEMQDMKRDAAHACVMCAGAFGVLVMLALAFARATGAPG